MLYFQKGTSIDTRCRLLAVSSCVAVGMVFGSTPAHAHDGVTMYCLISTGFNYVSNQNGQPLFSAMSGTMQAPRLRMRLPSATRTCDVLALDGRRAKRECVWD